MFADRGAADHFSDGRGNGAIIPTAVLSTDTMFQNYTFHDLTDEIAPIARHWQQEQIDFAAIYTGYLGSKRQVQLISDFFDQFKSEDNFIFVDPVMADNGKLYPLFDLDFAAQMARLCAKADIIVPNLTEACFLTGTEYREHYDEQYIETLLDKAGRFGNKTRSRSDRCSFGTWQNRGHRTGSCKRKKIRYVHDQIPVSYHGTGIFSQVRTVGALALGKCLQEALEIAADYTVACIRETMEHDAEKKYGVNFERVLLTADLPPWFIKIEEGTEI